MYNQPFHWSKLAIAHAQADSVWSDLSTKPSIDVEDVASIFALTPAIDGPAKSKSQAGKSVATVIGPARAQNVAIMLSRFRLAHSAIKSALLGIDDSRLSVDNLKSLRQYTPTVDEVRVAQQRHRRTR